MEQEKNLNRIFKLEYSIHSIRNLIGTLKLELFFNFPCVFKKTAPLLITNKM